MTEKQLDGYARQIRDAITETWPVGGDIYQTHVVVNEQTSLALAEVIERMIEQKFAELAEN